MTPLFEFYQFHQLNINIQKNLNKHILTFRIVFLSSSVQFRNEFTFRNGFQLQIYFNSISSNESFINNKIPTGLLELSVYTRNGFVNVLTVAQNHER